MHIGIDLGTTRSAVGIVEAESTELVPTNTGDRLTPSVVFYDENGDTSVGRRAINKLGSSPDQVIENAKRKMGEDHTFDVSANGVDPTPVDVSAEILKKLKSDAERFVDGDEELTGAHITVPAYFTIDQKTDTMEAAERAGFNEEEVDLLHEPTAAAISHGYDRDRSETVLIYDFGGGTLDIAVMEIDGNDFRTLSVSGNTDLGGHDFTQAIVDILADQIEDDSGINPRNDDELRANLRELAEDAKIDLSGRKKTEVKAAVIGIVGGEAVGIDYAITREEFENAVEDFLDQAMEPIETALDKGELEKDDVDRVLLVGGSSQIPAVKNRIEDKFGFEPSETTDLDWAVAQGAGIVAGDEDAQGEEQYICPVCGDTYDLYGDWTEHVGEHDPDGTDVYMCRYCDETFDSKKKRDDHHGLEHPGGPNGDGGIQDGGDGPDITPIVTRTLGTGIEGNRMDPIITASTDLPAEKTQAYTTTRDNQTELPIHVYQGENWDDLGENTQLADWWVEGIPEMPEGGPIIEVTFKLDRNHILTPEVEIVNDDTEIDDKALRELDIRRGRNMDSSQQDSKQTATDD